MSVKVEPDDIAFERIKSDAEHAKEGGPIPQFSNEYLETLALYRKIAEAIINFDVILFHGSAVMVDGRVYLFTAKSGTGKSTHTRLWRELFGKRAVMVNDDKPLISLAGDVPTVYGTPWNGKHHLGENISAPLAAICILERAVENTIAELPPMQEFPKILSQTYRKGSADFMVKTLALLDKLLHNVRVFKLGCNMNIEAARVAYEAMKGN